MRRIENHSLFLFCHTNRPWIFLSSIIEYVGITKPQRTLDNEQWRSEVMNQILNDRSYDLEVLNENYDIGNDLAR